MEYFSQPLNEQYDQQKETPGFQPSNNGSESKVQPGLSKASNAKEKSTSVTKTHSCYVCGKTLSSTSSYYVHMKQHSGHKPYHCPLCDVSFCRKPYLEVHMRTHTGERPFQCNVCLKRFTQKSSLNIHKRAHTGERPYSCDICDKKFAVKSYLDAHRWTHVFEKPLSCEKCKIPFNSKSQYILHMRSHSTNLNYECPCGRTFSKDSYLIRHQIKVHHPNPLQNAHIDNTSIGDFSYSHLLLSGDALNKKNFELSDSTINLTADLKKNDSHPNTVFKQEMNSTSSVPIVSSVIRSGIQSYIQDSTSQLDKL